MKKMTTSIQSIAAVSIGLTVAGGVTAGNNPFEMTSLESGYRTIQIAEAKCGGAAEKSKESEAKCGSAAATLKASEANGESGVSKVKEGKCGEAKCGGSR